MAWMCPESPPRPPATGSLPHRLRVRGARPLVRDPPREELQKPRDGIRSGVDDQRRQNDVGFPVCDDHRLRGRRHSDTSPHRRLPRRRAPRTARNRSRAHRPARRAVPPPPYAPLNRTSIRSRKTDTPSGKLANFASRVSTGSVTRIPVTRAFRSSATSRARLSPSPRKAARARCFGSWRRNWGFGSVLWLPVSSARRSASTSPPGPRDAQEPFHARPGEQGPVECLELADGVGDGEGGFAGIVFTRWRPDLPATA